MTRKKLKDLREAIAAYMKAACTSCCFCIRKSGKRFCSLYDYPLSSDMLCSVRNKGCFHFQRKQISTGYHDIDHG